MYYHILVNLCTLLWRGSNIYLNIFLDKYKIIRMRHKKIQPIEIRIKRIALEGILYVQVVMISLKIMVQKKKRNKTKIKYLFQGHLEDQSICLILILSGLKEIHYTISGD